MSYTKGPLTVRISEKWPFNIETFDPSGELVFSDTMPCHSTRDRSAQDAIDCVYFKHAQREEYAAMNRRAIADAVLRAAAPELLEALQRLADRVERIVLDDQSTPDTSYARAAIAKALGEQP